jgi:hypothetical protein
MDPVLSSTIDHFAQAGAAQFSGWNPSLFEDYWRGTLPRLWIHLKVQLKQPEAARDVAAAYARLLCESIGKGYLRSGFQERPANLMEYCFRNWLPARLVVLPPEQHLGLLARSWNLLEGLLCEPRWVNAYVMARISELGSQPDLESFLAFVLEPLFEPSPPARWNGPFRVSLLSMRQADYDFLPGDMYLVAPTVLAVKDRRRELQWGVLLQKQGRSDLACRFDETSPYAEGPSSVSPRWQGELLSLEQERIGLPFLREPFRWLQVRAGFVVASAVDSQKLWIVESAT